jgi:hypothetical protein
MRVPLLCWGIQVLLVWWASTVWAIDVNVWASSAAHESQPNKSRC